MRFPSFIIFCLFFLSGLIKYGQALDGQPQLQWEIGEELKYQVKWTFVKLGEIKLQVVQSDSLHSRSVYHCRVTIDSSPELFFIDLHDVYESYIDAEEYYSHLFRSREKKGDHLLFTQLEYLPDLKVVRIHQEKQHPIKEVEVILDSTIKVTGKIQDTLSLLFLARAMAKLQIRTNLEVMIYSKFENTFLHTYGVPEVIGWANQHISAYPLNGQLKFVGLAGVKDRYLGWFSIDEQSVPLKANMKAFIGNVKIELKEWKNWKAKKDTF